MQDTKTPVVDSGFTVALEKLLKMVDITIVNFGYFMVYKPTNISGGHHAVLNVFVLDKPADISGQ